jgi:hypothetical protein
MAHRRQAATPPQDDGGVTQSTGGRAKSRPTVARHARGAGRVDDTGWEAMEFRDPDSDDHDGTSLTSRSGAT